MVNPTHSSGCPSLNNRSDNMSGILYRKYIRLTCDEDFTKAQRFLFKHGYQWYSGDTSMRTYNFTYPEYLATNPSNRKDKLFGVGCPSSWRTEIGYTELRVPDSILSVKLEEIIL